jgi:hypothetical protein
MKLLISNIRQSIIKTEEFDFHWLLFFIFGEVAQPSPLLRKLWGHLLAYFYQSWILDVDDWNERVAGETEVPTEILPQCRSLTDTTRLDRAQIRAAVVGRQ